MSGQTTNTNTTFVVHTYADTYQRPEAVMTFIRAAHNEWPQIMRTPGALADNAVIIDTGIVPGPGAVAGTGGNICLQ